MRHASLAELIAAAAPALLPGPLALVMAEDEIEVESTLRHLIARGFQSPVLLAPAGVILPEDLEPFVHVAVHDVFAENALPRAVNRFNDSFPGAWIHYCYNAEYLFFPFCESRSIREMLAFHAEERRSAMLTYVVDLYAGDLTRDPNAVARDDAWLDRTGYYALARKDAAKDWAPKDRQLDFFGGLRWRFEEHVPWPRRKIDRISIFRARRDLVLRPDFTFNDEEMNTYSCPWHHNLTAAVCSFRTAKALRANPGSRHDIPTFRWRSSTPFQWQSQQLMDLGLMEPGQWF